MIVFCLKHACDDKSKHSIHRNNFIFYLKVQGFTWNTVTDSSVTKEGNHPGLDLNEPLFQT